MEYKKDFDKWSNKKKILNNKIISNSLFFLEGEIWWASIGVNIGEEIDGKNEDFERPILIIRKFDENNFIGIPITSTSNEGRFFHPIQHKNAPYYVSLKQIRFLNIRRLLRLIRRVGDDELIIIRNKIIDILH